MKKTPLKNVNYYERFRDMIEDLGERYGDRPAISWFTRKAEEKGVSYREFREDVRNLQEKLLELGLADKHIAIVGENCYEWILVSMAANYCGSVAVFVDTEQSDDTIIQMLNTADTDAVFCSAAYQDVCKKYTGEKKRMFLLSGKSDTLSTVRSLIEEGAVIREKKNDGVMKERGVTPDHTAAIVFTSGTTSYSKAVMLSQAALLTNASDAMVEPARSRSNDSAFSIA